MHARTRAAAAHRRLLCRRAVRGCGPSTVLTPARCRRPAGVQLHAERQPELHVPGEHTAGRDVHQHTAGACAAAPPRAAGRSRPRRAAQFRRSIEGLQDEWQGWTYDLLSRNCNHFCEALVEILGVGPLPGARLLSPPRRRGCRSRCAGCGADAASRRARPGAAWVNRFAVNADYALETSQTALTEVKKIWKSSADTLTLASGWLKEHLTIGAHALCACLLARPRPGRAAHAPDAHSRASAAAVWATRRAAGRAAAAAGRPRNGCRVCCCHCCRARRKRRG